MEQALGAYRCPTKALVEAFKWGLNMLISGTRRKLPNTTSQHRNDYEPVED